MSDILQDFMMLYIQAMQGISDGHQVCIDFDGDMPENVANIFVDNLMKYAEGRGIDITITRNVDSFIITPVLEAV